MAAVTGVETILPLHHHAQVLVVQDDGLGRDFLNARGGQFLDVHQERAVAVDIDHLLVRPRNLGAQRRRVAKAHRTKPGAGEQLPWLLVLVILSGPHLVLADAGGQDGLAAGQLVKHLDDHLWQDDLALGAGEMILHVLGPHHLVGDPVAEWCLGFPAGDLFLPRGEFLLQRPLADHVGQALKRVADLADHRQGDLAVLVDLRRVDVDVDNRAVLAEFLDLASHAVVKPYAKSEQQVGSLGYLLRVALGILLELAADGPVGVGRAVHAEPAQ